MRKKTIILLYVLGLLFSGVAVITFLLAMMHVMHLGGPFLAVIAVVLFLTGSVLGLIAWIGTLINQGKQEQWGWFVCTLLFGGIVLLIYLIAIPERLPLSLAPGYGQVFQPQAPMDTPPNQPSYPSFPNNPRP